VDFDTVADTVTVAGLLLGPNAAEVTAAGLVTSGHGRMPRSMADVLGS
jgi:hypothetical protein